MDYASWKEIPAEQVKPLRYTGALASVNTPGSTQFYCARYSLEGPMLTLWHVIMDCSDRHEGVVLKPRWSFTAQMFLINQPAVFRRLEQDELAGLLKRAAHTEPASPEMAAAAG